MPPDGSYAFRGGNAVVGAPSQCKSCKHWYGLASLTLWVDACNHIIEWEDTSMDLAMDFIRQKFYDSKEARKTYVNTVPQTCLEQADGLMCYRCVGINVVGHEKGMLRPGTERFTSDWCRMRMKQRRPCTTQVAKKIQKACQAALERFERQNPGGVPTPRVNLREVQMALYSHPGFGYAGDFNQRLGPGIVLAYSCVKCGFVPAQPNAWVRTVPHDMLDVEGGTTGSWGRWQCCSYDCGKMWGRHGDRGWDYRVIITPAETATPITDEKVKAIEDESVTLFEPEYVDRAQLNFFGHGTHVQETTVTVLKTAVFASVIRTQNGDIPLDDKLLNAERKLCYDAIEHLNNDVYRTIVTSVETTLVKTMTVEKLFTDHGNAPFCENVSCSQRLFQGSTRGFFASKSLHMFNDDERDIFLDSILPFFNLEDADGSPNSAMQTDGMPKAWARARERQAKAIADMEARYWTPEAYADRCRRWEQKKR